MSFKDLPAKASLIMLNSFIIDIWTICTPPALPYKTFLFKLLTPNLNRTGSAWSFPWLLRTCHRMFLRQKGAKKILFFCAEDIFMTYAPLADRKENFSREFIRGTCRVYPCNDTNKLHHGGASRFMNIWKWLLCFELFYTCWPQFSGCIIFMSLYFSVM